MPFHCRAGCPIHKDAPLSIITSGERFCHRRSVVEVRAATLMEILSFPSSLAGPLRGWRLRAFAVPLGRLIEQAELRFSVCGGCLLSRRDHTNHLVLGCDLAHR